MRQVGLGNPPSGNPFAWVVQALRRIEEASRHVDKQRQSFLIPVGNETTGITAAAGKVTYRVPYGFKLATVRASLTTAQVGGTIFTVDINKNGTTLLSTKITIDNGEKTSKTAATPAVISVVNLTEDDEISVDVDQIGDGTAAGLKITLIGDPT